RDDEIRIDRRLDAKPAALGAHALRIVEGEALRSELRVGNSAASGGAGIEDVFVGGELDELTAPDLERFFDRFGDAGEGRLTDHQTVDDHVDEVLLSLVEGLESFALDDLAVHAQPNPSLLARFEEELPVL